MLIDVKCPDCNVVDERIVSKAYKFRIACNECLSELDESNRVNLIGSGVSFQLLGSGWFKDGY